jgi:hypothetical protein
VIAARFRGFNGITIEELLVEGQKK